MTTATEETHLTCCHLSNYLRASGPFGWVDGDSSCNSTEAVLRHLRRFQAEIQQMTDLCDYLLKLVGLNSDAHSRRWGTYVHDSRFLVHQTKVVSTSLVERWQLEIQLQSDKVAIKSADAAFRLATLATVFLPLSLASSLLAMTTRFKDLRLLLYDFLGVSVLLVTAALLAWIIIRMANNPYGLTRNVVYSLRKRLGYNWIPSLSLAVRPMKRCSSESSC